MQADHRKYPDRKLKRLYNGQIIRNQRRTDVSLLFNQQIDIGGAETIVTK